VKPDHVARDHAIWRCLSMSAIATVRTGAVRPCRLDREQQLAQAAVEEPHVRAIGDDGHLQRRRRQPGTAVVRRQLEHARP